MYKILCLGELGKMVVENEGHNPFYFRPTWRIGKVIEGTLIPQQNVAPDELQFAGIDKKLIEGIIGENVELLEEKLLYISQLIQTLDTFYFLRDVRNPSDAIKTALEECMTALKRIIKELNPNFEIENYLSIFNDIEKHMKETRLAMGCSLKDKPFEYIEIRTSTSMLNHDFPMRAYTIRLVAELALALGETSDPLEMKKYYNTLVLRLGIMNETNRRELDLDKTIVS